MAVPEFEAQVRLHEQTLHRVALKLCREHSEARDLVQDTLERAFRAYGRLEPGSNVRPWLVSILRNCFIDVCRRRSRAPLAPELDLELLPAAPPPDPEPGWAQITDEQLRVAVSALPDEFRAVYVLHTIESRSYVEISQELGIPKATVGTRLLRARRKLRDLLAPHLPPSEEDEGAP